MENPSIGTQEQQIRTALTSKWSKLTTPDLKEIVADHKKLTQHLKSRYSMTQDDAQKASVTFFKPFESKKGTAEKR